MILDKLCEFDPANTAITAGGPSTNTLDMLQGRDLSIQTGLTAIINVQQTFLAAGAATLQVQLRGSVDNVNWTVLSQSDAIQKANLTLGQTIALKMNPTPPQGAGPSRYYQLNYVVGTGPFTAGAVQAELVIGRQANIAYPAGYTVTN